MARSPSYRTISAMYRHNPDEIEMESEQMEGEETREAAPSRRGGSRQDGALNTHYRNFARAFARASGQIK